MARTTRPEISSVIVTADLLTTNSGAANSAAIRAAIAELALNVNGGAGTIQFPPGAFNCDGSILVTGFYPMEAGGWNGGILFKGAGIQATRLTFASQKAFIIDPTTGTTGSTTWIDFEDMHIIGPGKAVSGSTLLEYAPQVDTVSPAGNMRIRHQNLYLEKAETLVALVNNTNYYAERCRFWDATYHVGFGYNTDVVTMVQCMFGSSLTSLGSQSETALYYNYIGHYTGGSGISNNAHTFIGCIFLRLLVAADIYDSSCATIKFDSCYYESCVQYALLGNSGTSVGPRGVVWDNCHFSLPYVAGETAAKIKAVNAASDGSITISNSRSDSSDCPNYGWIDAGTSPGMSVHLYNNWLPIGTTATRKAHIVYNTTKFIVAPSAGEYHWHSSTSVGQLDEQFNGSGSTPHRTTSVYGGSANTIFQRYNVKPSSSETPVANAANIVDVLDGGTHYVNWFGHVKIPVLTALPAIASGFQGFMCVVNSGAGGEADKLYIGLKGTAGTYSWVQIVIAP